MKHYYVYILRCRDGALYTGYTRNMKRRFQEHKEGRASRFTRSRLPVRLVYSETHRSVMEAMRRERQIKSMTRREKLTMIGMKAK